jgi:hypothetical protein
MFNALKVSKEWNIPQNTALMHVSIVVILTMASQSALNPSLSLGSTGPSPSSPGLEADMVAMVAVMPGMAMETVVVKDVSMVMVIKLNHAGIGKAMLRLSKQSPLLVGLENIKASGA